VGEGVGVGVGVEEDCIDTVTEILCVSTPVPLYALTITCPVCVPLGALEALTLKLVIVDWLIEVKVLGVIVKPLTPLATIVTLEMFWKALK